jgi:hypothetical protein
MTAPRLLGLLLATGCATAASDSPLPGEEGAAWTDDDADLRGGGGGGAGGGSGSNAEATQPWKVLNHDYQAQQTGYWCGPAATRIALSARRAPPTQQTLANQLPTTTNGTDRIDQVTTVLNSYLGGPRYDTAQLPNDPPNQAQRDKLWRDVVLGIDSNHPVVTNIVAPPSNHPPGYPNETIFHYFTAVGYNPTTREVYIADPANFGGHDHYWLTFNQFATLIPPKGYSYYRCGSTMTKGDIDRKYRALGGCGSFLGAALTEETATPDGLGRYNVFQDGSIYWSAATGAFEVHGAIRDKWAALGWEVGALGYPISDETPTASGGGRFSVFQRGSIYWSPATGAHEVRGAIRDKWAEVGWETGALGFPVSDEYAVPAGRQNDFQRGSIEWNTSTQTATVTYR